MVRDSDDILAIGRTLTETFDAGRLRDHIFFWKTLTNDSRMLKMIGGCVIEFKNEPIQTYKPTGYKFSHDKKVKIDKELDKMIKKRIIEEINISDAAYISNIFTRPKSDGSLRVILDLTNLNENIEYNHFKMDNLQTAVNLMTPGCWFASIDWKDAYYSVPMAQIQRKFLAFNWRNKTYQYTCLPNGLCCAPRYFCKITKILFAELRKKGHVSTSYIDDCLLIADCEEDCRANVLDTARMSLNAGFVVHPDKSVLKPTQKILYLGFWLDSRDMSARLPAEKAEKLKMSCEQMGSQKSVTLKKLSRVIGLMVSSFQGVQYGQLFYRRLDNLKNKALKDSRGRYDVEVKLTSEVKEDIDWWVSHIKNEKSNVVIEKPELEIETDASKTGWGACVKGTKNSTGGNWTGDEAEEHINCLELLAIQFGIQCFGKNIENAHIKVLTDNTTAVAYINSQGGTKHKCNQIARDTWLWCYNRGIWLSAAHLPGSQNVIADKESRTRHDNMEWVLDAQLFQKICDVFGRPEVDLFANRLNHHLDNYMSWKPDPQASAVDAMSVSWKDIYFYAFPPFNMILKVIQKIELEQSKGVLVVPYWPTQPWWPKFTKMSVDTLVLSREREGARR